MKNEKYRNYVCWGVTATVVLSLLILLVFILIKWERVAGALGVLQGILAPIIYGAVLAYLLTPVYNQIQGLVMKHAAKLIPDGQKRKKLSGVCATLASLVFLLLIIFGLFYLLMPQLIESVRGIVEALPNSIKNLGIWLEGILADNPDVETTVMQYYTQLMTYIQNWLVNDVVPNLYNIVSGLYSGVFTVINVLTDLLIGLIVMIYLLNMKEKLVTQAKMVIYGVFPVRIANKVLEEFRFVHHVFGGFIIGKLKDSLIIGVASFFMLGIMKMPYVLLVSVIIGVTNVIPFFGPFIGAIPSAFLILLVDPMKCLYFVIFVILLQQVDGNIIGPKILGDSTGLSSFWVLFSILLFGGVFGFVGMIIGVPTFAVIYRLTRELVEYLLAKRRLSRDIEVYDKLDYIDAENGAYKKK